MQFTLMGSTLSFDPFQIHVDELKNGCVEIKVEQKLFERCFFSNQNKKFKYPKYFL